MTSPFLVKQDFISPSLCEQMIESIKIDRPDTDKNGDPLKLERSEPRWDQDIAERFKEVVPEIVSNYNCKYKGLSQPVFQFYPENPKVAAEQPGCENSRYVRKRWVVHKDVDLVGYIWLKDFNSNVPLDTRHEIYGGKMEFPVYNFSLVPQRGTMVLFPAGPHFIHAISPVLLGDLYQIKLNVSIKTPDDKYWLYQPANFTGTYEEWFREYF